MGKDPVTPEQVQGMTIPSVFPQEALQNLYR